MALAQADWFKSWFDSPYYHLLYQHRNKEEACQFMDRLITYLKPPADAVFMDMPCGRGRHAEFIHSKGFHVTGVDLSQNSINFALKHEEEGLEFYVHDMRRLFRVNYYDYILNLFTSLGYFNREDDNLKVIQAAASALKKDGTLVVDFFNAAKVRNALPAKHTLERNGVTFYIEKQEDKGSVVKQIRFHAEGKDFAFEERVSLLSLEHFQKYFALAGLHIVDIFGDYKLSPFVEAESDRLILIAKK